MRQHAAVTAIALLARVAAAEIDFDQPVPAVIRRAIHAAVALRETHGTERRAMNEIVSGLRRDGELRFTYADLEGLYANQEIIFRRGQDDGDLIADLDPRVLAVTYQGTVEAMLGYLDAHPNADAETHAGFVADILLTGITRSPSESRSE